MKLILEESLDIETVVELNEATGEKTYIIKGIFSTPELKNRNGRIYPMRIWEENVSRYQQEIENQTQNTLMEKEHPPRTEVDPEKAVARIRKLEIRDGKVYGESVIFNKPETKDIRERIDAGKKIGVSSRGVGRLNGDIVEEFTLVTYDIVRDPSDWNANLSGFNESLILESVEIEADNHGGWICTPTGCTLKESKDITKEVEKRLKSEPVMITNEMGNVITIEHKDGKSFEGVDQHGNGVVLKSLKGYILVESQKEDIETPCSKKAKELKEALEKIAKARDIEIQKEEEESIKEKFEAYISAKIEESTLNDDIETKKIQDDIESLTKRIFSLRKKYKDPISKKHINKALSDINHADDAIESFYEYEFGKDY